MTATAKKSRWVRASRLALIILTIGVMLVGLAAFAGWQYLFGRTGDPVQSHAITFTEESQDTDWQRCQDLFVRMERTLKRIRDLEGILCKQELVDGRLEPETRMVIKARRNPKSVYLRWIEPFEGREAIFEARRRRNRIIAHEGGNLRSFSPDVIMERDHPLAMQFSRHPLDELSLQYLLSEFPKYVEDAKKFSGREVAVDEERNLRGRDCIHIRIRYAPGQPGPELYRRFDVYLDRYEFMPIRWERYGQTEEGEDQLLEYFELIEFERNVGLTDEDFDPDNDAYNFNANWRMEL